MFNIEVSDTSSDEVGSSYSVNGYSWCCLLFGGSDSGGWLLYLFCFCFVVFVNWGGYGFDGLGDMIFYTSSSRSLSRGSSRNGKLYDMDCMVSLSCCCMSLSDKCMLLNVLCENFNVYGLEMKFDWFVNRVEKFGEF